MVTNDDLISTPVAGSILGICRQQAYRLTRTGELPAQVIAGRICVRRSDAIRVRTERELRTAARAQSR